MNKSAMQVVKTASKPKPVAVSPTPAPTDSLWIKRLGYPFVVCLASAHLLVAVLLFINYMSHEALTNTEGMLGYFCYNAVEGVPLYGQKDIYVQPCWYTPLAFQVTGVVGKWMNYDIRAMRLTIALFGFGSFLLVGLILHRLTRSTLLGFIGAALFSGDDSFPWFAELAPNAPITFFTLLAIYLLCRDPALSWRTVFLSTVALLAAFWSKQTAIVYVMAGLVYFFLRDYRKGLAALSVVTAAAACIIAIYGRGLWEALTIPSQSPLLWNNFWSPVLFPATVGRFGCMIVVLLAGLFAYERFNRASLVQPTYVFLGAGSFLGLVAALKYGSGVNQGLVFHALLIILGLVFLHRFRVEARIPTALFLAVLVVQSAAFVKPVAQVFITDEDDARHREVLGWLKMPDRTILFANSPFHEILAGLKAHAPAGQDCWRNGRYDRSNYPESFRSFYEKDPFDLVIMNVPVEDGSWLLWDRLTKNYTPIRELPAIANPGPVQTRWRHFLFARNNLVNKGSPQRAGP